MLYLTSGNIVSIKVNINMLKEIEFLYQRLNDLEALVKEIRTEFEFIYLLESKHCAR